MRLRSFALITAALTACLVSVSCPNGLRVGRTPAKPSQWRFAAERVDQLDASVNNMYNYVPPGDTHTFGMIESNVAAKLGAIADSQDSMVGLR